MRAPFPPPPPPSRSPVSKSFSSTGAHDDVGPGCHAAIGTERPLLMSLSIYLGYNKACAQLAAHATLRPICPSTRRHSCCTASHRWDPSAGSGCMMHMHVEPAEHMKMRPFRV